MDSDKKKIEKNLLILSFDYFDKGTLLGANGIKNYGRVNNDMMFLGTCKQKSVNIEKELNLIIL